MIDPRARWAHVGEKPDYAGLLTFCGLPYTEDPADLAGAAAVILGAPMDELVSDNPGTRHGPRAIRAASALPGFTDKVSGARCIDTATDRSCVRAECRSAELKAASLYGDERRRC